MKNEIIGVKAFFLGLCMACALLALVALFSPRFGILRNPKKTVSVSTQAENEKESTLAEDLIVELSTYNVISVTDGDTFVVDYNGVETPVRLIGVNTPETVDPRKTVECFGKEASDFLKELLTGKKVILVSDPSQSDRDKYDRLLRYVYLPDEDIDVGSVIILGGYGYEYTYNVPHAKQELYKKLQALAEEEKAGLWADGVCGDSVKSEQEVEPTPVEEKSTAPAAETPSVQPAPESTTRNCDIKGNINYSGERIYHVPGQEYYNDTIIDTSRGERWFCSEEEARAAGWRRAKV